MRSNIWRCGAIWSLAVLAALAGSTAAEDAKPAEDQATVQAGRYKKFTDAMNGVTLKGQYSLLGKKESSEEAYEIKSVKKSEDGDYWLFNARIKYGGKDIPMIFPLEVKWAGVAPVIVMDEVTIPGMGTFSCRVVFDDDRYAGNWSHGKAKGHLWGTITKTPPKTEKPSDTKPDAK